MRERRKKEALKYIGNKPYTIILRGIKHTLHKGDILELPLKSLKYNKRQKFEAVKKEKKI